MVNRVECFLEINEDHCSITFRCLCRCTNHRFLLADTSQPNAENKILTDETLDTCAYPGTGITDHI